MYIPGHNEFLARPIHLPAIMLENTMAGSLTCLPVHRFKGLSIVSPVLKLGNRSKTSVLLQITMPYSQIVYMPVDITFPLRATSIENRTDITATTYF